MFELLENDRLALSRYIEAKFGIQMPESKKVLLQTRLQKRASSLGYDSIHSYLNYLFGKRGQEQELDHFATIISTHKTEFFREREHFTLLMNTVLPELGRVKGMGRKIPLVVWSAASSTGEEVYSIAMCIDRFFKEQAVLKPSFRVTGSDISQSITTTARKAVYQGQALSSIPSECHVYLMRNRDRTLDLIRVVPELRLRTSFFCQNLMDTPYRIPQPVHIIFCRNVLIYFDRATQHKIVEALIDTLDPGGYLFIGHSESLSGMQLDLDQVQMTLFRKPGGGR